MLLAKAVTRLIRRGRPSAGFMVMDVHHRHASSEDGKLCQAQKKKRVRTGQWSHGLVGSANSNEKLAIRMAQRVQSS